MFILTFAVIGLSVFFYLSRMKTTLLFLSFFLSANLFAQKNDNIIIECIDGYSSTPLANEAFNIFDSKDVINEGEYYTDSNGIIIIDSYNKKKLSLGLSPINKNFSYSRFEKKIKKDWNRKVKIIFYPTDNSEAYRDSLTKKQKTRRELRNASTWYLYEKITIPDYYVGNIPELKYIDKNLSGFQDAMFPGGNMEMYKFLSQNVYYPQSAIDFQEQGRVFTRFVVERDGSISNVMVDRGISSDLDKEAKRVIRSMPRWIPAIDQGYVVRSLIRLPINFRLK